MYKRQIQSGNTVSLRKKERLRKIFNCFKTNNLAPKIGKIIVNLNQVRKKRQVLARSRERQIAGNLRSFGLR